MLGLDVPLLPLLAFGAVITLAPVPEITVADRAVRLGDVARVEQVSGPARARLAGRVIATLPPNRDHVVLSRAALAGLIRRAAPSAEVKSPDGRPVTIRTIPAHKSPPEPGCFALARPVARGEILASGDVEPAPCTARERGAPVVFDRRDSVARAGADLLAGAYLGQISLRAGTGIDRGDALTLISSAGPVRIERRVAAVQAAGPGRRLFVQDEDGQVISAPLATDPAAERRE